MRVCVFLAILTSSRGYNFDNLGDFGGLGKACRSFACSAGSKPVPAWPFQVRSTGCSGIGSGMSMSGNMDANDGELLEHCCDMRHACLQICGAAKKECDTKFKECTDKACKKQPIIPRPGGLTKNCSQTVSLKVLMAQIEGCKTYDMIQARNCKCKKKKTVEAARGKMLTKFYRRYAGGKEPNLDKLIKKYGKSKRRFATLLMKLVDKYAAKAVKHVEDPQQKRMREMFSKIRKEDEAKKAENPDTKPREDEEVELVDEHDDHAADKDEKAKDANQNSVKEEKTIPNHQPKAKPVSNSNSDDDEEVELVDDDEGHSEL